MADLKKKSPVCLSCGKGEEEIPLLMMQYAGKQVHICPHCLPVLIHHTERLAEKIAEA